MISRKSVNLQEKISISENPQKKFNEIDFKQEEPYWNFILRLPGPEKHPSNRAPEGKQEIRHSKKFDIFNYMFYDFLKKMHWSPRMAEKWVLESVERPSGGLWPIYIFIKNLDFSNFGQILIWGYGSACFCTLNKNPASKPAQTRLKTRFLSKIRFL